MLHLRTIPVSTERAGAIGDDGDVHSDVIVLGEVDGGEAFEVTLRRCPDRDRLAADLNGSGPPSWWPALGCRVLAIGGEPGPEVPVSFAADFGLPGSIDRLESDLGLWAAEHLADYVAVHAAVVRIDGRIVVLPGPSHTGKSSLCGAVLDAGGEVLSDEYALLTPDGARLRGWPRRVKLRNGDGGWTRVGEPTSEGLVTADLLAALRWDASARSPLEVEPLTPGEVVTTVLANTVCAASRPVFAFDAAVGFARVVPGIAGTRGEARAAVAALATLGSDT